MKKPLLLVGVMAVIALLAGIGRQVSTLLGPSRSAAREAGSPGRDLGYGSAFAAELQKIGQISPEEFAQRYGGKVSFLPKLDWDPTDAMFFDRFNLDPKMPGAQVRARGVEEKMLREAAASQRKPLPADEPVMVPVNGGFDFRLNGAELAAFKQNGFVVSERMGAASCTDMFYRIYKRDLPVLITSDAILHAWHRSYDAILEEVETLMLSPALDEILAAMANEVPGAAVRYGQGLFADSVPDADYVIAVARSLLAGHAVKSKLDQDARVTSTVEKCEQLQLQKFVLFGKKRDVDFSQFKPRGHYEKSEELKRYFRAMMWCGRIDLRIAGNPNESSERELASAVVLHDLMQKSGKFALWSKFDRVIQTFVGEADSMTFAQLAGVLGAAGIHSPADVKDPAVLDALGLRIGASDFGAQEIRGDVFLADPLRPGKLVLPRSFTFLGQKFAVDSWVMAQVVYDDILWDDELVKRRIPSCLDVSFAVFGNDHTVPMLVERIKNPSGRKFRDGLNYQHNLAALRTVIDAKPESMWKQNLYTGWLGCLRELSKPTTGKNYPEAMQTQAWAMKTLNTQHASWTQLRHDTILYVKQSYTAVPGCYYPAGYVEPVPHFWARLEQMATRAADLIDATPYPERQVPVENAKVPRPPSVPMRAGAPELKVRDKHVMFLRTFAETVATLRGIAEKELSQKELTKDETKFLEDVIETRHERFGSGAKLAFAGWYPALFYFGSEDSRKWDALVADVHTNPPAPPWGDPGCVLHQGVGGVDLLLIAVDSGKDRMVYAGPVLSHYEFEVYGVARKSDSEWKEDLKWGRTPPRPEWTRSYLVPGPNPEIKTYRDEN